MTSPSPSQRDHDELMAHDADCGMAQPIAEAWPVACTCTRDERIRAALAALGRDLNEARRLAGEIRDDEQSANAAIHELRPDLPMPKRLVFPWETSVSVPAPKGETTG